MRADVSQSSLVFKVALLRFCEQSARHSLSGVLFVGAVAFAVDVSVTLVNVVVDGTELPPARFKLWFSGDIIDPSK